MPRLDFVLAQRTGLSRSQTHKLIASRRVTLTDSLGLACVASTPKTQVDVHQAQICIDGAPVLALPRLAALYKPVGFLTSTRIHGSARSIWELVPENWRRNLHPVGRLDLDTSGLLLLSSEGDLTHLILHPDSGIEKEYEAVVQGFPVEDSLRQVLQAGVPSKSPHDPRNYSGEVLSVQSNKVRLVVTEGRHRMVRRMLANAGFPVLELHRSRIGGLELTSLQLTPGAVVAVNANTVLGSRYAN